MKSRRVVWIGLWVGMVSGLSPLLHARDFEGLVDYEIRSNGKVHVMHYQIKPPRLRLNTGNNAILFNPSKKESFMLMPERKTAMRMPVPDAKPQGPAVPVVFADTGRKETIAGHECRVFTFKGETSEGEICNAHGMGTFYATSGSGGSGRGPGEAWEQLSREKELFPLRVTSKNLKQGNSMTMVATRIENKALPAADFEVPAGYTIIEGFGAAGMAAPPNKVR